MTDGGPDAAKGRQRESPFLIGSIEGYAPTIGHLVSMMTFARSTTLAAVEGLAVAQLDVLLDEDANSIGMLLAHIASTELDYQNITMGRPLPADEDGWWEAAMTLGPRARERIRGHGLDHYLLRLAQVRDRTLAEFARLDDAWLFAESDWWGGRKANNYFKWFHVIEDELSHRGQIRLIRKRLPK